MANGLFNPATKPRLKDAKHALFFQATFMDIWGIPICAQEKLRNMPIDELTFVLDYLVSRGHIKIHLDRNVMLELGNSRHQHQQHGDAK